MPFDATVTVGNVLTLAGILYCILTAIIVLVGHKYFPTKAELRELREHVDEQIVATRTDVETAVRGMENLITKEMKLLNEHAKERYDRHVDDSKRIEQILTASMPDIREARDTAREARAIAENTKESLGKAVDRIEGAVTSLLSRQRDGSRT